MVRAKKTISVAVAVVLVAAVTTGAWAEKPYRLVDLGPAGHESGAMDINSAGQVAGWTRKPPGVWQYPAFWDSDGSSTGIGGVSGSAEAINSIGQVVGIRNLSTGYRGFIWDADNGVQNLGDLPGGQDYSEAKGINDAGQVVGISSAATGYRGFLWEAGTSMRDLGDLPGGQDISYAIDVNNHGQVAGYSKTITGWRAFLWNDDVTGMRNLGELPGGDDQSMAFAVNDGAQVVGYSEAATGRRAFLWDADTDIMQNLGDLPGGPDLSIARAINNRGQVVGDSHAAVGQRAFLWDADNGMRNIDDLVDDSAAGWELKYAYGINDLGHIVGYGQTPGGEHHAFVLLPEPATLSLLAVAGLAMLRRRF